MITIIEILLCLTVGIVIGYIIGSLIGYFDGLGLSRRDLETTDLITKTVFKQKVIELLKKEKWYPIIKPTKVEIETSQLLNKILDTIIEEVKKL